jgi:hypothetical protein
MRLMKKSIVGATYRDECLEALDKDVLLLAPMRQLEKSWEQLRVHAY